MKAKLVPIFYETAQHPDFIRQVHALQTLPAEEAEILEPVALDSRLPDADAVVFPQMLGDAYRMADMIGVIPLSRLVIA